MGISPSPLPRVTTNKLSLYYRERGIKLLEICQTYLPIGVSDPRPVSAQPPQTAPDWRLRRHHAGLADASPDVDAGPRWHGRLDNGDPWSVGWVAFQITAQVGLAPAMAIPCLCCISSIGQYLDAAGSCYHLTALLSSCIQNVDFI